LCSGGQTRGEILCSDKFDRRRLWRRSRPAATFARGGAESSWEFRPTATAAPGRTPSDCEGEANPRFAAEDDLPSGDDALRKLLVDGFAQVFELRHHIGPDGQIAF